MRGASPYSTGGGGTVLEHRYGALLLSHLLTADPIAELGDDVTPREINFQASSFSAVDDLVVSGYSADRTERRVSIGVRRNPSFIASDAASVDLIGSYLRVISNHSPPVDSGQWRLALAVASPNSQVQQLGELASIARDVIDESHFRAEVARPGRTRRSIRERLVHFDKVVAAAARRADIDTTAVSAHELSWRLLRALRLRQLRLEGVDESDRALAVARLRQVTITGTADAADKLFSRLCELVGRYAPAAATKDEPSLRRDLSGMVLSRPAAELRARSSGLAGVTEVNIDDIVMQTRLTVHSDYLSQVRRIAPALLLGREQELARLAEFCTASDSKSYLWLRAQAWAGKSALLSSFVLNPPAGVRIISFFVTARLAGQGDRVAFCDVILEQALELIGEPMPVMLTDATRDGHLLGSLARATHICQQRGERLVLIVDGLDEDQGVTSGPDAHSIAAMLPTNPPTGMRVIVAGRPNPPIPADVPDDHPLRHAENIWHLIVSPHAEVVRQDAERELKRLLRGSTAEQDLLGLLTAAGGGLSGADLAELTGSSTWEIEDRLCAVSGRTFASRAGHWRPDTVIYVLGHEDLQQQAIRYLGADRLRSYRDRLHMWAEGYRVRNWPTNTPEYLLRGYFTLLHTTRDIPRMLATATDPDRHDRMLDIIGGDNAALTEITTTQEIIATQVVPDLLAMSRLAVHRAKLAERNENIPASLPGVWAQLGRPGRAEALARSITDRYRQVQAFAAVIREVAAGGDVHRAEILSAQAEWIVPLIADPYQQAQAFAAVARAVAEIGKLERARSLVARAERLARSLNSSSQQAIVLVAVARVTVIVGNSRRAREIAASIHSWSERAQALAAVAREIANSGDWERGRSIALSISSRSDRAQALAAVAQAVSAAGDRRTAARIAEEANAMTRSIRNPGRLAWTLIPIAEAMAGAGLHSKAADIIEFAEQLGESIKRKRVRESTLSSVARVTAITRNAEQAERVAGKITSPYRKAVAFTAVASELAARGHQTRGEILARKAEEIARSITFPSHEDKALAALSRAVAAAGDIDRAESIARQISEQQLQGCVLTDIIRASVTIGDLGRAETITTSITDPAQQEVALLLIVKAGISSGDLERAEKLARSVSDADQRAEAIRAVSHAVARVKDARHTQPVADSAAGALPESGTLASSTEKELEAGSLNHAEVIARSISDPYSQFKILIAAARTAATAGDAERAEKIINFISHPQLRVRALISISETKAIAGDRSRVKKLVDQAVSVVCSIASPALREQATIEVAQHLARTGFLNRAEILIRSLDNSTQALSTIAVTLAELGNLDQAERIILAIPGPSRQEKTRALVVQAGVSTGDLKKAETIARAIADPILQAQALSFVARMLAMRGRAKDAENVAQSINDPSVQARTLTALTANLRIDEARRLLANALMIGHWQICLEALVHIEPDSIEVIASEFLPL